MRAILTAILLSLMILPAAVFAGDDEWDVNAPLGPTKEVTFTTDEGTWMNLDVSPDGKEIIFDLLGDIYVMPISGGDATLLLGGPAYEVQPRFSPDGTRISFTSDRAGGDNIWIVDRDGTNPVQVTKEDFRLVNNACWTPDGDYIVAKKHFTSTRSLGAGEMWIYHASGGGKGLQLTKRKNDQQDVGEPCVSVDGRHVYFSEDMSGGSRFQYNKDPNGQIYMVRRYDRESGETENIIVGPGGAVRPQISPDGSHIAFVRRVRTESVLYIHNLETGEQTALFDGLYKDQQETWATFGVYPNYNWTPDGDAIVVWAKGKIWRVEVASAEVVNIPFEVEATHVLNDALRFTQVVSPATFEAKMIRHSVTSPDGKLLVFGAVGHLYRKKLPDGKPERLTKDDKHTEYFPAFSRDGKWIVYTTWNDDERGAVYKVKTNGKSQKKLTEIPGVYVTPSFSPDGDKVVFRKRSGDAIVGFTHGVDPGLYWISADGGDMTLVRDGGSNPLFSRDGERIYFTESIGSPKTAFKSVLLNGGEERTLYTSTYANYFVPSPDEEWLAFSELYKAYVVPFTMTGKEIDLSAKTTAVPVTQVARDAGTYLHWSGESDQLYWTIGSEYYTRDMKDTFAFVEGAADSIAPPDTSGIDIGLTLATDVPDGKIALVGARIITMNGDEVIEDGTILIDRNRIEKVGPADRLTPPPGYKVIDVAGKTIMPGLIDVHAHMWHGGSGLVPDQSWPYYANLAFGVTTTHDPSNWTDLVFTMSEMVRSGELIGPRVYSTGTILYGADGNFKAVVSSLDDARSHLRRMKAQGAFSVKSYNQPRREQRQQVIVAARELEMMVVPEGGSFFFHNMTMILDGHTGIEHTIPIAPIYSDVLQLWGASEVGLTPTLVVGYGGIWGENYWYQNTNVWENERLLNFTPRPIVDSRSRRRMLIPDDDFNHFALAKNCKDLVDVGVTVELGAHGQRQGLGAHWELWMFEQGGMSEMEALRCGTIYGAHYIGMDADLGSIEPGKLADLVVLNTNPLENIRNSEDILYTMVNGRIFDAMSMRQIGNYEEERAAFYWERTGSSDAFVWRGETHGFGLNSCGCFTGQ